MHDLMYHHLGYAWLILVTVSIAHAEPVDFHLPAGFVAEEIYRVPNDEQGSWICMTVDNRGRLITSDQKGALYRVTIAAPGGHESPSVEKIELDIGMAMGLLYARDSLYVMVNGRAASGPGLYRLSDTNDDDRFDSVKLLRAIEPPGNPGAGHGNHAIVAGPDGQSLYLVCGNMAGAPAGGFDTSRVPTHWGEDQLLPRVPDSRGHASKIMAPGGWIAKTDFDGRHWELVCSGFRNVYDAAFNRAGDLFTFDADMEFDLGTPWYRPTRVCHVVSGGEFGWRNGSGKWPAYYPDSLPSVIDVGLGSPTGLLFGYGTNFPPPYRDGLFLCDWSYGRIYIAELERQGASYVGKHQLFASFAPLPVVDMVAHPVDRSLYLVTGGRGVQSHIYRIRYVGRAEDNSAQRESVRREQASSSDRLHALRQELEALHRPAGAAVVGQIWPQLRHNDRYIRFAACIALEHQPVSQWQERLALEKDPRTLITASIALARCAADAGDFLQTRLDSLQMAELTPDLQLDLLRAYGLVFIRHGRPQQAVAEQLGRQWLDIFPTNDANLDRELSRLLAYLRADGVIEATLPLLDSAATSADQMHFAMVLRVIERGWTLDQRKRYFNWFRKADDYVGGRVNGEFARQIRQDAEATLNGREREQLASLLARLDEPAAKEVAHVRPLIRRWTVDDLTPDRKLGWDDLLSLDLDVNQGSQAFSAVTCERCHQVRGQGGRLGPDLSGATGRYSPRDLLEAIIEPSKTIPHEFQGVSIVTTDGRVVTGQIVNLGRGGLSFRTDPLEPWKVTRIKEVEIDQIAASKTSLMPSGLLDTLTKREIFNLLAWLAQQD